LACGHRTPPDAAPAATLGATPLPVRTAVVRTLAMPAATAPGTVFARQRALLAARISATVRELPFEEGAAVRRGQVVAGLDDRALRAQLAAAESQRDAARVDAERYRRLLDRNAATPREAEAAAARAADADAAVAAASDALAYAVLRAPFDGHLARRLVRVGDVASPGQPLVELEGDGGYELRTALGSAEAATLSPGLRLTALVDGAGELEAIVRAVSPAGDPGTQRFEAIADLPPAPRLRSGLFGRLRLPAAPGDEAALAVPAAATFARGGLTGVFVAEDGVARLRWIAPGERRGDLLVVRAGVAAGERTILDPTGLADGATVSEEPQ
jgi:RND family efflux transporter MFP subunit